MCQLLLSYFLVFSYYKIERMDKMTLDELQINKTAHINKLNCTGDIRRRLLDLGIIPNTVITPVMSSLFGDIRAYEVRGTVIAFRKNDAKNIEVHL